MKKRGKEAKEYPISKKQFHQLLKKASQPVKKSEKEKS
jgi:hypothetical protein